MTNANCKKQAPRKAANFVPLANWHFEIQKLKIKILEAEEGRAILASWKLWQYKTTLRPN